MCRDPGSSDSWGAIAIRHILAKSIAFRSGLWHFVHSGLTLVPLRMISERTLAHCGRSCDGGIRPGRDSQALGRMAMGPLLADVRLDGPLLHGSSVDDPGPIANRGRIPDPEREFWMDSR